MSSFTSDSEQMIADIHTHLSSPRPDVRCEASKALIASLSSAGSSSPGDGSEVLAARMSASSYIDLGTPKLLCRLVSSPVDPLTSEALPVTLPAPARMSWSNKVTCLALDAASSLMGAGSEAAGDAFVDAGMVGRAGEVLMDQLAAVSVVEGGKGEEEGGKVAAPTPAQAVVNSVVICLANLSRSESGSAAILEKETLLTNLIKFYLERTVGATDFDPFAHVSTVLMNLAQIPAGRQLLLRLSTGYLPLLLPFLVHHSGARRYGTAGIVKNVCFDKNSAFYLIDELDIVKDICYPLCGPEGFDLDDKAGMDLSWWMEGEDKRREEEEGTRMMLVESILLLCATGRRSREILRKKQVYAVIKVLDLSEESEAISEKISECVDYLMRDEEGTPEYQPKMITEEAREEEERAKSMVIKSQTNYDDVD